MNVKIKIKNSVVCLGGLLDAPLKAELAKFDLANKTPMECMEFVRKLKKYGESLTARL